MIEITNDSSDIVEINNVSKSYSKGTIKAVDNLNLSIRRGEIFGLLGVNGAGKTTTIKMIIGLLNPDKGCIKINGYDIQSDVIKAKMNMGYIPDSFNIYEKLTGIEYVNFLANVYNVPLKIRKERIEYFLDLFDLRKSIKDMVKSYSHGMKQKLVLMGGLIHNPALWVLDEPIIGLDPKSAHTLKELMKKHCQQGNTVLFSTHILEIAEKICDRVGIIHNGKLIAVGKASELMINGIYSESLEKIFLELTK